MPDALRMTALSVATTPAPEEVRRLAALGTFKILDTPPEPQFDRLVQLASQLLRMPIVKITFIDQHRQWFKARTGVTLTELSRDQTFCTHTIAQQGVLVIPDATQDPRVNTLSIVTGDFHLRFYAGVPLITATGENIGTFCVFDQQPRDFPAHDQHLLASFAELAMDELKLRKAVDDLAYLALHDPLTGLPNRLQFRTQLEGACQEAAHADHKVVLGLLDLNQFKLINDTLGHPAGDEVLRLSAERLQTVLAPNHILARMSGDEFTLILPGIRQVADTEVILRQLQQCFQSPLQLDGQEIFVQWSIGLSVYPDDAHDVDLLLQHADTAMYQAKRAGRSHVYYTPVPAQAARNELHFLTALHHAVEQDELRLYAQPVVDAHTHQVVGHEALLRWASPTGLIPPLEFIPVAEATGLILPIGRWVRRQAVQAVMRAELERVCVNVSALEFQHPEFLDDLRQLLVECALPADRLWLELTESSLLQAETSADVLRQLQHLGVRLVLDDFGTGYSSLTALSSLPVQVVKISARFTAQVDAGYDDGQQAVQVIRGIVMLARAYGLETVAEGVETLAQASALTQAGCTYLQGFLFGRPTPLQHAPDA